MTLRDITDFPLQIKCIIKSCKKRVNTRNMKPGQSYMISDSGIVVFCSDKHWQIQLQGVAPHH